MTPSQAEVLRVFADHEPLTLLALGELLVCETGNNPSRLVDRLVTAGLVQRQPHHDDRRHVTLSLTEPGRRLAEDIMAVEDKLYRMVDDVTDEMPLPETLTLLRKLAGVFPAGQALSRRAATGHGGAHE